MTTPITPELVRSALACIPANLPRDEWARVAMAIKSEFPDESGLKLFDTWSATADGYDASATKSTWRSVKAGGSVGIGTLLYLAKEHGFELPKSPRGAPSTSSEEKARQEQEKAQRDREEQARTAADQEAAADKALARWNAANEEGQSPYLVRKGVQAHGVRFELDGTLLVPVRDEAGKLWNLQRIAPQPLPDGGDKRFLKGGRKSGCWHQMGAFPDASDSGADAGRAGPLVILVSEGYATAATVHEATGMPAAAAFDAGNLLKVAKALRQRYPSSILVLCGDDDVQTSALKGVNPGREKATAAAQAVGGLAVFPTGLPDGGSDFNDMASHIGGADGLAAVQALIESAVHQAAADRAEADLRQAEGTGSKPARKGRSAHAAASGDTDFSTDRFSVNDDGVWYQGIDQEGNIKKPEWVCSRLDVQATTNNTEGAGWGYLLHFKDRQGRLQQWAMPSRMLSGDGGEYRSMLLDRGLRIAPSPRARNLLTQYIQTREPNAHATCTERIGWHGTAFVLPHKTIGDSEAEKIVFQSDVHMPNPFRSVGTVEQWQRHVAGPCVGNSRPLFALACSFAGPLLLPAGLESGGFHFRGGSSSGKTTSLKVASSVYGPPSFMEQWRATENAIENIAAQHSDCVLVLDELAQSDPKAAGECAYMLANGQSKARATKNAAPRARLSWRVLFLSSGELSLADHMAEGMKRIRAGQEVRMVDIPADAGAGTGAFECLHDFASASALSTSLVENAARFYGAVGYEWLHWLTTNASSLRSRIKREMQELVREWVPEGASGQVSRVGARFALVAVAGEMATQAGLTGWPEGESIRAARVCFDAWVNARGGSGNGEVRAMLSQVKAFLEMHGDSRFTFWHRGADDHSPKTLQRAGFKRMVNEAGEPIKSNAEHQREYGEQMTPTDGESVRVEYFVLPESFKTELCRGYDHKAVARVLLDHECLLPGKGRTYDCKQRLPGIGVSWCFRITPALFALDL